MQLVHPHGPHGVQSLRLIQDHTMNSLIQISRYKFSLVISGLTIILQRVKEIVSSFECHNVIDSIVYN